MATVNNKDQLITKSLDRALKIIETIAYNKTPIRIQDIVKKTKIPESTIFRILNTLIKNKYVIQEPNTKKYFLTFKITYLGNLISSSLNIRDIAKPYLLKLSEKSKESASLVIEQDSQAVYIDFVEGPDKLLKTLSHIGRSAPLHCTAVGKCLLLNYSAEMLQRYIERKGLIKLAKNTITKKEDLIQEIRKVKMQGYAVDSEECEEGVMCVAAPIYDFMGKVIASVSVTGPSTRLTNEYIKKVKDYVIEAAKSISICFSNYEES